MSNAKSEPIKLFALGGGWGVPFFTGAPFPLKLAAWMRMAGIPFEIFIENNPGKGPKGKSPWIEQGALRMGDSSLIIEHLAQKYGIDLDGRLTTAQRALGVAVQRMLEEHYHQCFEHQLFFGRGGKERENEFASSLPFPLDKIVPIVMMRAFRKQLHARGMGRHTEETILAQGCADLDALAELMGDGPFFHGPTPSSIDACVFGFLGVTVYINGDNPLFRHASSKKNLMRYCERMRAQYFPETFAQRPPLFPNELKSAGPSARAATA